MKKFNLIFTVLILLSVSLFSQGKSGKLIILHTNDLHSNLTGFSPEIEYSPCVTGNDSTLAGFSRIAALIDIEKRKNSDNLLVLDAGDFLMGTFFHIYEADNGFQLQLMKKMGYDVVSLGNHEFDFGPATLTKIIDANRANGEIPLLTLANVEFNKKSEADDSFENLYATGIVKKYQIIERNGLKIGVFGILGDDAYKVAPNVAPLKITNRIKSAKKIVKILEKDEQVDFIICLSHSGVNKDKNGKWAGEDVELAKKVKGINVIISGHTHTTINDPIWIGETAIVQAGAQGKNLGRFEINIADGKINSAKYKLIPVNDDISGDCNVHKEIAGQIRIVDDRLLKPMGFGYYKSLAETDYDLVCDELGDLDSSNLGPLLADAIHYYVNTESDGSTDVALIAAGVIRDKFRTGINGIQIVSDVFRVVSLGEGEDGIPGYPLAKVYLTGNELKKLMELLIVAGKMKPAFYCFFSGIEVEYDSNKRLFKKIQTIKIGGNAIDLSKKNETLYSLTANSYMLEFVGEISSMTFGLVKIKPKDQRGIEISNNKACWIDFDLNKEGVQEGKEWMAVVKYLQNFPDTNGNNIPDFPDKYRTPILRLVDIGE